MTLPELLKKYPTIFSLGDYSIPDTWIPIVDDLCAAIEHYETSVRDSLAPIDFSLFACQQMKEKFGTLRFYYNGSDIVVDQLIKLAEYRTMHTCQKCGSHRNVTLKTEGWWTYLCDKCLTPTPDVN